MGATNIRTIDTSENVICVPINFLWYRGRLRPTWPKTRENAARQIQINLYKNLTFIKSHM